MATSNETVRPVILSRPENTAVGFLILSACAMLLPKAMLARTKAARPVETFIEKHPRSRRRRQHAAFALSWEAWSKKGMSSRGTFIGDWWTEVTALPPSAMLAA